MQCDNAKLHYIMCIPSLHCSHGRATGIGHPKRNGGRSPQGGHFQLIVADWWEGIAPLRVHDHLKPAATASDFILA